jgi:hypothetical protein
MIYGERRPSNRHLTSVSLFQRKGLMGLGVAPRRWTLLMSRGIPNRQLPVQYVDSANESGANTV